MQVPGGRHYRSIDCAQIKLLHLTYKLNTPQQVLRYSWRGAWIYNGGQLKARVLAQYPQMV
jgi:hypothetical protein